MAFDASTGGSSRGARQPSGLPSTAWPCGQRACCSAQYHIEAAGGRGMQSRSPAHCQSWRQPSHRPFLVAQASQACDLGCQGWDTAGRSLLFVTTSVLLLPPWVSPAGMLRLLLARSSHGSSA